MMGLTLENHGLQTLRSYRPLLTILLWSLPMAGICDEEPLTVEEILSAEPDAEDYAESVRCLPVRRIRSATALDDQRIVFRVSRNELYLVQLSRRCPGIRRNDTIVYEATGGMSLCRNDSVRGVFGYGLGRDRLGPRCPITDFQQVTPEQLDLIRESLKQAKSR